MSTDTILQMQSNDSAATEQIAAQLGQKLKGGEVIELVSDLGGGKTTFVRGLARGASSTSHVSSPTFKISNVYHAPSFEIAHYDFYRLPEAGLIKHELADVLGDPTVVIVVEWAGIVHDVLPAKRLTIRLKMIDENQRQLEFSVPKSLSYLLEGIKN